MDDDWIADPAYVAGPPAPASSRGSSSSLPKERRIGRSLGKETLTFSIGSRDVGKLIGRAGVTINELRDKSGCKIDVGGESESDRRSGVDITVSGPSEDSCRKCKDLIEDHLGYNKGFYNDGHDDQIIDWAAINAEHEKSQKERWAKCPTLIKAFYQEHPDVTAMTEEEVDKFRLDNNRIVVQNFDPESSASILRPVVKFEHAFHAFPEILKTIRNQKFERPSPVQAQAWPYLLSGKDVIGVAQTGTGKTLAFLMPAFIHIDEQPVPRNKRGGPNVLVMCPTRELALQIEGEVRKYEYRGIKSVCVYGGGDRKKQMDVVTAGVQVVIATPGRLNDLVEAKCVNVESITYLVLDEADRMLDMGFEPQIRKVMLDIRPDRQTVMTSATWPPGVRRLATSYMNDPVTINIGSLDLAAVHSVTQQIIIVENEEEKRDILMDFFSKMEPDDKVMVFVGKKVKADDIASDLGLGGIDCQCIHGDREQSDREQAINDLKSGDVRILVATDVASRGIDINDITYVFNFDFPRNIEEYVHRVGRTGRAGKTGTSITLMEKKDRKQAQELIEILKEADQYVPDDLIDMAERYASWKERSDEEKRLYGGGGGGRGARADGADGCFRCGQSGHFSRECPQGGGRERGGRGGGGGGGGGNCYNCNKPGHLSRNCPQKSRSKGW